MNLVRYMYDSIACEILTAKVLYLRFGGKIIIIMSSIEDFGQHFIYVHYKKISNIFSIVMGTTRVLYVQ